MATVSELKATARPKIGKGAARAERRAGKVPGVIYGDNQPPLAISVDHNELRQRIFGGHFLTTIYELDVEGARRREPRYAIGRVGHEAFGAGDRRTADDDRPRSSVVGDGQPAPVRQQWRRRCNR